MRNIITIISLIGLSACNAEFKTFSQAITKADCPSPKVVYLQNNKKDSTERFNFHIYNIESNKDTIKFQSLKHDFVFCRANNSWTVQPGTINTQLLPRSNYTEISKELVEPEYKSINFQGKTYKYRVGLEPGFVLGTDNLLSRPTVEAEKDRVVFELLVPNSKPVRHTLYTLKDLQQKAVKNGYSGKGIQLGFPRITASLIHGDALWWAIAFEQAEGNTGIATMVSYQPQVGIRVIQPPQLGSQQITDLVITGDQNNPTFWMGTKISGEGNEYLLCQRISSLSP